jgi:L-alanine-DL-glutamate epimerase-like enolase superfamily enzyme
MKIIKISLYKCSVNIGFKYSTWETKSSQAMLIKIETDNGLIGWGEYTINRWKTEKILISTCKYLLNKNVLEIYNSLILKSITGFDKIDEFLIGFDRRRRLIREGMSIALYDLVGKYKKKPIYELFERTGAVRTVVDAMPVIHVHSKEDRLEILQKWEKLGVVFFKIKITGDLKKDKEHLSYLLLNKKKKSKIVIVDANYGYKKQQDIIDLSKFTFKNNIGYIQNPIRLSLRKTAKLMKKCDTQFTADNTPWWPYSKRVITKKACVLVNHHPNIQGGLDWLMRTADYAKKNGLPNIIGSSGTFGIQNTAFQAMSAITGLGFPCEEITLEPYMKYMNDYYSFNENPNVIIKMNEFKNGNIYINNNSGLGVDINEEKIKKLTIWSQIIDA